MPASAETPEVRALLLDVEGTTTPVSFVYDVLFPYARARLERFLERHRDDAAVRADLARLREEHAREAEQGHVPPPWDEADVQAAAAAYLRWLMDRDRKSTALKSLQGRIWETGYHAGELRSEVYPDVPLALARWRAQERDVAIFSSGSVLAQRLLFAHSTAGDLTPFIRSYFDTTTGAKSEAGSYRRIAEAMGVTPPTVLFLSDVIAELDAAREGRMQTAWCVRPPAAIAEATLRHHSTAEGHPVVHTFDEVFPEPGRDA